MSGSFVKNLLALLDLSVELSENSLPAHLAAAQLVDATRSACRSVLPDWNELSTEKIKEWDWFVVTHLAELLAMKAGQVSEADRLFDTMWRERPNLLDTSYDVAASNVRWMRSERKLKMATRLGDIGSACFIARLACVKLKTKQVQPVPTAAIRADPQCVEHESSLARWVTQVEQPVRRRFYTRFSHTVGAPKEEAVNTRPLGKTLVKLLSAWQHNLDSGTLSATSNARTDTETDRKLCLLMLTAKFAAQMILFRGAHIHQAPVNSAVVLALTELGANSLLVWTLASYERLYRILALQIQANTAEMSEDSVDSILCGIQKLINLAREHNSASSHWHKFCTGSFFDDFLVCFENALATSRLSPHEHRGLQCAVQTTDKSLRILMRLFSQTAAIFVAPLATRDADDFLHTTLVAQQRAMWHLAAQTDVIAKMTRLIHCESG